MRLDQYMKEAFVSSVMNDVPQVDYQELFTQAVNEDMLLAAPTEALKAALLCGKTRQYIVSGSQTYGGADLLDKFGANFRPYKCGISSVAVYGFYEPTKKGALKIAKIMQASMKQKEAYDALRVKVAAAIKGCSTRAAAVKLMPELEKYLPRAEDKTKYLPANIANLASDLVKAGWPKGAVAA